MPCPNKRGDAPLTSVGGRAATPRSPLTHYLWLGSRTCQCAGVVVDCRVDRDFLAGNIALYQSGPGHLPWSALQPCCVLRIVGSLETWKLPLCGAMRCAGCVPSRGALPVVSSAWAFPGPQVKHGREDASPFFRE